ncbi:MAG: oxaloacetate decarboxylase, partial [Chloroflexi bacterium]|nr:oxaloacetate decarboxylase [Chloroflexota bacterium]
GNALNVRRTIREYERAGVAAVHLEDQQWPKKCGHFEGKRLIPSEEMVGKIRAAVDARTDPDFVIIARTDAIAVNGFDDAIKRGKAYEAAGADVIFVEAPRSREDAEAIGHSFSKPLLFNMAGSGKTPFLPADEVELLGFKVMIFPSDLLRAAAKTMQEVLVHLRETGCNAGILDRMMTFKEYTEFLGLPEIYEAERRYGIT